MKFKTNKQTNYHQHALQEIERIKWFLSVNKNMINNPIEKRLKEENRHNIISGCEKNEKQSKMSF